MCGITTSLGSDLTVDITIINAHALNPEILNVIIYPRHAMARKQVQGHPLGHVSSGKKKF